MASTDNSFRPRTAAAGREHAASAVREPVVSVVVVCRDAAGTIGRAVDSVLAQAIGDIELIIVDDGSTEDCRALVSAITRRDPRITLIEQATAGASVARNRGVRVGQAPLIAFLDATDFWTSEHLARHVAAFRAEQRLGVSISPCTVFDAAGEATGERTRAFPFELSINDVLMSRPALSFSALVVHRDVFLDTGPFHSDGDAAEIQAWLLEVIAAKWIVAGIAEHSVMCRADGNDRAETTQTMMAAWANFLQYARGAKARQPRPSALASLARGQPSRGRYTPSHYMDWFPRPMLRAADKPDRSTDHPAGLARDAASIERTPREPRQ